FSKPPEVLEEQALQLTRSFGYSAPVDSAYTFSPDRDYYSYLAKRKMLANSWQLLKQPHPALIRFWYRQSPTALLPFSTQYLTMSDPPNIVPGMVRISLNTEGQLAYLEAVPEQ